MSGRPCGQNSFLVLHLGFRAILYGSDLGIELCRSLFYFRQRFPGVLSEVLCLVDCSTGRLERRFELATDLMSAPKGNIDWSQYATRQLPRGNFLSVPCTFPDLRDDRYLKGAIRFALEKQVPIPRNTARARRLHPPPDFLGRVTATKKAGCRDVVTTPYANRWWYFDGALEKTGNRFPSPAPPSAPPDRP